MKTCGECHWMGEKKAVSDPQKKLCWHHMKLVNPTDRACDELEPEDHDLT